jgi:hypothetical protein
MVKRDPPRWRWRHAIGVPDKQGHADPLFQQAQPVAGGRQGNRKVSRRTAEAAAFGNRDHQPQIRKVKMHGFSNGEG